MSITREDLPTTRCIVLRKQIISWPAEEYHSTLDDAPTFVATALGANMQPKEQVCRVEYLRSRPLEERNGGGAAAPALLDACQHEPTCDSSRRVPRRMQLNDVACIPLRQRVIANLFRSESAHFC